MSTVSGQVRGFQSRSERDLSGRRDWIVWTYKLDRSSQPGRLPPVPVEMRGRRFDGFFNEGDEVELLDPWREGRVAKVKRVRNVTTGVIVRAKGDPWWVTLVIVIILIAWGAWMLALALGWVQ